MNQAPNRLGKVQAVLRHLNPSPISLLVMKDATGFILSFDLGHIPLQDDVSFNQAWNSNEQFGRSSSKTLPLVTQLALESKTRTFDLQG